MQLKTLRDPSNFGLQWDPTEVELLADMICDSTTRAQPKSNSFLEHLFEADFRQIVCAT